jgi:glycosyltransferase involved in cell wall biosynthesis
MFDKNLTESLMGAASFMPLSIKTPNPWCGHLPFAAWVIETVKPKIFVELGTHSGNSYFAFCQSVKSHNLNTKCFAIDTWEGDSHAGSYSDEVYREVCDHNKVNYQNFSKLLRTTFDEALSFFEDESIDLLHIDGLHTYEAVKHDFETWLPKLSTNAIVLFHDTQVQERGFGVWKFWNELKKSFPCNLEFSHSYGLGVIQLGAKENSHNFQWMSNDRLQSDLINYFSSIGGRLDELFTTSSEISVLKQHMLDKDVHIRNLEAIVEICKHDGEQKDLQIDALRADFAKEVGRYETQKILLEDCRLALQNKDTHILNLNAEIRNKQHQILSLQQAGGWSFISLRNLIARAFGFFKRLPRLTKLAISNCGGINPALFQLAKVFRSDGQLGVRAWLNSQLTGGDLVINLNHRHAYQKWIEQFDGLSLDERLGIKGIVENDLSLPTISILMPVYKTDPVLLGQAIKSVVNQLYKNWELIIVDDGSNSPELDSMLINFSHNDLRIKHIKREHNGHISVASNDALNCATGDYIALMDHDDLLHEAALFFVGMRVLEEPNLRLIYTDEDKVDMDGNRYDPYFKCEFNLELFLAQNMISHFAVYHREEVLRLKGFRLGFEGAQDYDLALRMIGVLNQNQIAHIPRVLYHWRASKGSTALNPDGKSYAVKARINAVSDFLKSKGIQARVELSDDITLFNRVRYQLPDKLPLVSIIIPTRDRVDVLKKCVDSVLRKSTYKNIEILIVDNGSIEDETLQYLSALKEWGINVIRDDLEFNFSRLNNIGANSAKGEYLCLMNNDIEIITPDWLEEMMSFACQPNVGCVGARLWYPDGRLQHGGVILGIGGVAGHSHKYLARDDIGYFGRAVIHQCVSAVTAACLVISKKTYQEVGGLDESLAVAFNDVDFCLKVGKNNYRNIYTPYAEMIHHESISRGAEDSPEKQVRFMQEINLMKDRWANKLQNDFAYSPNLTNEHEDFSFAWPPRTQPLL